MLTRQQAVELALGWRGTPYVTGGRVRGAGCDCATLLSEYLIGIGGAAEIPLFTYAQDWFCHATEERYFNELSKYARCTWEGRCQGAVPARPGDIMLFRCNLSSGPSPLYNHGCIVTEWPRALHCFYKRGVGEIRPSLHPLTARADMAAFNPWPSHGADALRAPFFDGGIVSETKPVLVGEMVTNYTLPRQTVQRFEEITAKC